MSKKASLAKKIAHTLMAMSIVYSSGINIVINEAYAAERTENITSGGTKEFEEKTAHKTEKEVKDMSSQLMDIVAAFGGMQSKDPADSEVQAQVKKLQKFITEHYYNCSKVILNQLGQMYGAGGAFTENINAAGGAGAAEFAQKAIEIYCK